MDNFNMDNTEGYTQKQLDSLNNELEKRLENCGYELGSQMYEEEIKSFNDEVSRR